MRPHNLLLLAFILPLGAFAAEDTRKTLAATMDVFVFPAKGQETSQQSQDEATCYQWAVGNTSIDPFELAKQKESDIDKSQAETAAAGRAGRGAATRGALRGAAAGALIGEIASDDAGEGAAWGAAAGVIRGRRAAREARQNAKQATTQKAEQREAATAEQLENFKKAFSVCLEAKKYLVKY